MTPQKPFVLSIAAVFELNPVRANMVNQPQDYRWSSYANHALVKPDDLIDDHPLYLALGDTAETRREAYRALFRHQLDDAAVTEIRDSLNKGLAG